MPWYGRLVIAISVVACLLVIVLVVASLQQIDRPAEVTPASAELPPPANAPLTDAEIAQCADCHADACREFHETPHMRTLTAATDKAMLDRFLGPDGEGRAVDGTLPDFQYRKQDGSLEAVAGVDGHRVKVDWVFGSGTRAQTPVAWSSTPAGLIEGLEMHLSWYPHVGLSRTFDHHDDLGTELRALGIYESPETLSACFDCHSTGLSIEPNGSFDPDRLLPGVRCDKCHHRVRPHLESVGAAPMERLSELSPLESIERCGTCHRSPSSETARKYAPDDPELTRFAPIGLSRSACFTNQGQNRLDCATCHDPHEPPTADLAVYNANCLQCHSGDAATCPDQPAASNCISCHMPKRKVDRYLAFTDHWIRSPSPENPLPTGTDRYLQSPHGTAGHRREPVEATRPGRPSP